MEIDPVVTSRRRAARRRAVAPYGGAPLRGGPVPRKMAKPSIHCSSRSRASIVILPRPCRPVRSVPANWCGSRRSACLSRFRVMSIISTKWPTGWGQAGASIPTWYGCDPCGPPCGGACGQQAMKAAPLLQPGDRRRLPAGRDLSAFGVPRRTQLDLPLCPIETSGPARLASRPPTKRGYVMPNLLPPSS